MTNIDFDLWIEDFKGGLDRYLRFNNYEEAQHEGMCAMNKYRNMRAWHVTVSGQRPEASRDPIPSSLQRWDEFYGSRKTSV